jgi:hypothetical protein
MQSLIWTNCRTKNKQSTISAKGGGAGSATGQFSDRSKRCGYQETGHALARLAHGLTFARVYVADDGTGGVDIGSAHRRVRRGVARARACRAGCRSAERWPTKFWPPRLELLTAQHAEAALAAAGRSMRKATRTTDGLVTWPGQQFARSPRSYRRVAKPAGAMHWIINAGLDEVTEWRPIRLLSRATPLAGWLAHSAPDHASAPADDRPRDPKDGAARGFRV